LLDIGLYDLADSIGNSLLGLLTVEAGTNGYYTPIAIVLISSQDVEVYDIRKTSDPTDALLDVLGDYLNRPEVRVNSRHLLYEAY
jgi:hypothetical protein